MPRYRLKEPAYIDNTLMKADDEIEFDGQPGPHMIPLDAAAEKAMAEYIKKHPGATLDVVERQTIGTV